MQEGNACQELVVKMSLTPWSSWGSHWTARIFMMFACLALPAFLYSFLASLTAEDFENADPLVAMVVAFSIGIPFFSLVSACILCFHCQRRKWVTQYFESKADVMKASQDESMNMLGASLSEAAEPMQPEVPPLSPTVSPKKPRGKKLPAQCVPSGLSLKMSFKNLDTGRLSDQQREIIRMAVSHRLTEPLDLNTSAAHVSLMPSTSWGSQEEPVMEVSGNIFLPRRQEGEDAAEAMLHAEALKGKLTGSSGQRVCEAIADDLNSIEEIHNAKIRPWDGVSVMPILVAIMTRALESEEDPKGVPVGHRQSHGSVVSTHVPETAGWNSVAEMHGSEWADGLSNFQSSFSEVSRMVSLPASPSAAEAGMPQPSRWRQQTASKAVSPVMVSRMPMDHEQERDQEGDIEAPVLGAADMPEAFSHHLSRGSSSSAEFTASASVVSDPSDTHMDLEQGTDETSQSKDLPVSPSKKKKWAPQLEDLVEDGQNLAVSSLSRGDSRVDNV